MKPEADNDAAADAAAAAAAAAADDAAVAEESAAVVVAEIWHLKPAVAGDALRVMQEMDDLVGPNAHAHPGWCGHARFLRSRHDPARLVLLYPWRSRELHEDLVRGEEAMLVDFHDKYCDRPREIHYYDEVEVEVEPDHDHGAGPGEAEHG